MRRFLPFLAVAAVLATIAACAAPAAPAWTYAPAPSVAPAPSGSAEPSGSPAASASVAPSPTASAEESESPEPSESAGASGSPAASGGTGLTIVAPVGASTSGFDTNRLEAEAGIPFTVTFDNQDTGVPHNFVITRPDGTKVDIGDTAFFNGVAEKTYNVPALDAGEYPFLCEVHPQVMKGVLTVG
jgi:plastocyanin